jgi:hypothetical protein
MAPRSCARSIAEAQQSVAYRMGDQIFIISNSFVLWKQFEIINNLTAGNNFVLYYVMICAGYFNGMSHWLNFQAFTLSEFHSCDIVYT